MKSTPTFLAAALLTLAGCKSKQQALVYQAIPVDRRDIIVSAQAAGSIQPDTTVQVKSLASGEVTSVKVQTGEVLTAGTLMLEIDRRQPKNAVDQSQAAYDQAKAQLAVAEAAKRRADTLYAQQAMTEADHDQAIVNAAVARSNLVAARVNNENNEIALSQTEVRAPINGTVISQSVTRGSMIAATGRDVSGGTTLFEMANLSLVQVHTLVDETDIGKIQAGQSATITVDAFPNRPFEGYVMKIEPQDTVAQNVTMFPVLVRIDNKDGLLRPGMNTEVEIHVGQRQNVLAVPNAALRTQRDYVSAAQVLGLDPKAVDAMLAAEDSVSQANDASQPSSLGANGATGKDRADGPGTMKMSNGTTIKLPEGVTEQQVNAAFKHMREAFQGGGAPSAEDRALLQKVRNANPDMMGSGRRRGPGGNGGGNGGGSGLDARLGGNYIVFVKRGDQIRPVRVRTGLTDLEYSEVLTGLQAGDSALVLPSASLVQSQSEFKERINRFTGGGGVPGMKSTTSKAK